MMGLFIPTPYMSLLLMNHLLSNPKSHHHFVLLPPNLLKFLQKLLSHPLTTMPINHVMTFPHFLSHHLDLMRIYLILLLMVIRSPECFLCLFCKQNVSTVNNQAPMASSRIILRLKNFLRFRLLLCNCSEFSLDRVELSNQGIMMRNTSGIWGK